MSEKAARLIEQTIAEASIKKRVGRPDDGEAWSYETPDFVWDILGLPGDTTVHLLAWSDWAGEGPLIAIEAYGTGGRDFVGQLNTRTSNVVAEAERILRRIQEYAGIAPTGPWIYDLRDMLHRREGFDIF